jgi:hypothetical protein
VSAKRLSLFNTGDSVLVNTLTHRRSDRGKSLRRHRPFCECSVGPLLTDCLPSPTPHTPPQTRKRSFRFCAISKKECARWIELIEQKLHSGGEDRTPDTEGPVLTRAAFRSKIMQTQNFEQLKRNLDERTSRYDATMSQVVTHSLDQLPDVSVDSMVDTLFQQFEVLRAQTKGFKRTASAEPPSSEETGGAGGERGTESPPPRVIRSFEQTTASLDRVLRSIEVLVEEESFDLRMTRAGRAVADDWSDAIVQISLGAGASGGGGDDDDDYGEDTLAMGDDVDGATLGEDHLQLMHRPSGEPRRKAVGFASGGAQQGVGSAEDEGDVPRAEVPGLRLAAAFQSPARRSLAPLRTAIRRLEGLLSGEGRPALDRPTEEAYHSALALLYSKVGRLPDALREYNRTGALNRSRISHVFLRLVPSLTVDAPQASGAGAGPPGGGRFSLRHFTEFGHLVGLETLRLFLTGCSRWLRSELAARQALSFSGAEDASQASGSSSGAHVTSPRYLSTSARPSVLFSMLETPERGVLNGKAVWRKEESLRFVVVGELLSELMTIIRLTAATKPVAPGPSPQVRGWTSASALLRILVMHTAYSCSRWAPLVRRL